MRRIAAKGMWLVALAGLAGLIVSLLAYFGSHNGIDHTEGALLVVVSTALMLVAALVVAAMRPPRWLRALFDFLILLDIFGTAFAGYMLEAYLLPILMAVALIGWLAHRAALGTTRPAVSVRPGAAA